MLRIVSIPLGWSLAITERKLDQGHGGDSCLCEFSISDLSKLNTCGLNEVSCKWTNETYSGQRVLPQIAELNNLTVLMR